MSYILDTHTFIWAISDKDKLSAKVRQIIDDSNNSIFVSAVTFWEISLKFSIKKLDIQGILPDILPQLSLKMGFQVLQLLPDESASYYKLPVTIHKDPFDRMLIWQTIARNYTLITKDNQMLQYEEVGLKVMW